MRLLWCLIVFALVLTIVSCDHREGKIDVRVKDDSEVVVIPTQVEDPASFGEPSKEEVFKKLEIEKPSIENQLEEPIDETVGQSEERTMANKPKPESFVNIYDRIDSKDINPTTLIDLVEEGINQIRKEKGLSILGNRRNLKDAATIQNDYCNKISGLTHDHEQGKYANVRDRVANFGGRYSTVGENIQYYGFLNNEINGEVFLFPPDYQEAAKDIVANWVESPGHYKNIINANFRSFGTAVGWNDQLHAIFVTQVYGG